MERAGAEAGLRAAGRPDPTAAAPVQNMLTRSLDFQWLRTPGRRVVARSTVEMALIFPLTGNAAGMAAAGLSQVTARCVRSDCTALLITRLIRPRRDTAGADKNDVGKAASGARMRTWFMINSRQGFKAVEGSLAKAVG